MKKIITVCIILFFNYLSPNTLANNFGKYNTTKTMLMNQQLQNYRAMQLGKQARYNYYSNPVRNIRYPNRYSSYPNIERNRYNQINTRQRYSPEYYQEL